MSDYEVGRYYVCDYRVRCVAQVPEVDGGWVFVGQHGDLYTLDGVDAPKQCHPACDSFDWQPPDPGEGYRLIDPAVDVPEKGDQLWYPDAGLWMDRLFTFDGDYFSPKTHSRRKIPVPAPEPVPAPINTGWVQIGGVPGGMLYFVPDESEPEVPVKTEAATFEVGTGYRLVNDDETIVLGDDVLTPYGWMKACPSVGSSPAGWREESPDDATFIWRRRV